VLPRRRTDAASGRAAFQAWAADPGNAPRDVVATAVRFTLEHLVARAPGGSTEVRVPPYAVVQCIEGPRHTRGTPPNVIETDADTWLELASGRSTWARVVQEGRVRASGERADLANLLPLVTATGADPE
jgi:hypothetical protein